MFAIIFLMLNNAWFNNINIPFALILFYVAVFFTIYSGVEYFYKNRGVFADSFGSKEEEYRLFTQADGLGFFVPVIRRKTERVVK